MNWKRERARTKRRTRGELELWREYHIDDLFLLELQGRGDCSSMSALIMKR